MSPKNKNITLLELLMGFFFSTYQLYYSYNILQLLDKITTTTILKKNSFTTTLDQKTTIVSPAAL